MNQQMASSYLIHPYTQQRSTNSLIRPLQPRFRTPPSEKTAGDLVVKVDLHLATIRKHDKNREMGTNQVDLLRHVSMIFLHKTTGQTVLVPRWLPKTWDSIQFLFVSGMYQRYLRDSQLWVKITRHLSIGLSNPFKRKSSSRPKLSKFRRLHRFIAYSSQIC